MLKILKAISFPVLPIVPECTYCAAMRFAVIGCLLTSVMIGAILGNFWKALVVGAFESVFLVTLLYIEYKRNEHDS